MTAVTTIDQDKKRFELALIQGDVSKLSIEEKLSYHDRLCESVGVNKLTRPFDLMRTKEGKEIFYSNKGCAEQLRTNHNISLRIVETKKLDDIYIVTTEAKKPDGRTDSSTGVVNLGGLKGEALANAMMKCETKSKRRVTLSICGLNMLDETEVDTIPGVEKIDVRLVNEECPEDKAPPVNNFQKAKESIRPIVNFGEFIPAGGRFARKRLRDIPVTELINYVGELNVADGTNGLTDKARDLRDKIVSYLAEIDHA